MKVLLTGITGNLGYEVSLNLARRGITVVPCVRPGRTDFLSSHPIKFDQVIECDLTNVSSDVFVNDLDSIDCIVHCAGDVHFNVAGNKNQQMMLFVTKIAENLKVPVYAVSTAFVYKPPERINAFNNNYEEDKFQSEQILISSGIEYCILRPSVLTGNSDTGNIQNFSGYYLIVRAFLSSIHKAGNQKIALRFPRMLGNSDMVPVDEAADRISQIVESKRLGEIIYITNPNPPSSEWILDETLKFYGVSNMVNMLDISFHEFGKLNLTDEELALYKFISHFAPYWSKVYNFPESVCKNNMVDSAYLKKILTVFRSRENIEKHG